MNKESGFGRGMEMNDKNVWSQAFSCNVVTGVNVTYCLAKGKRSSLCSQYVTSDPEGYGAARHEKHNGSGYGYMDHCYDLYVPESHKDSYGSGRPDASRPLPEF